MSSNTNITLNDAVMAAIRKAQLDMFVHLPGVVQTYDPSTQTISVQPSIDRKLFDKTVVKLPILQDVPIVYPRSAAGVLSFPLAKDDHVLLCFSQRSLDKWKDQGPGLPPQDDRIFDISDAFAIPGAFPPSLPLDPPPNGMDIRGETINYTAKTKFTIKSEQEILISAPDKIDIVSDAINLGESPSEPAVLGATLQGNLEDLIGAINDLVALIKAGQILGTAPHPTAPPATLPVTSTIVTAAVESALSAVESALADQNSEVVKLK